MKHLYILLFLFAFLIGCNKEKESTVKGPEEATLNLMREQITNDWKIAKMTVVKPDSLYGWLASRYCMEKDTFSFKADNLYEFTTDTSYCNVNNVKGGWRLPSKDSLYINYIPGTT